MKEKSSMEASQAKEELYKYILNYVISKDMNMEDATDVIGSLSDMLENLPRILLLSSVFNINTNEVLESILKSLEKCKEKCDSDEDEGDVKSDKGFKVNVEVTIKGEKDEDTDCSDTD